MFILFCLACYSKRNYPVDGNYAWEQLTRKLDDLKERDCAFAEVSLVLYRTGITA